MDMDEERKAKVFCTICTRSTIQAYDFNEITSLSFVSQSALQIGSAVTINLNMAVKGKRDHLEDGGSTRGVN